jgi:hypothetical protein
MFTLFAGKDKWYIKAHLHVKDPTVPCISIDSNQELLGGLPSNGRRDTAVESSLLQYYKTNEYQEQDACY